MTRPSYPSSVAGPAGGVSHVRTGTSGHVAEVPDFPWSQDPRPTSLSLVVTGGRKGEGPMEPEETSGVHSGWVRAGSVPGVCRGPGDARSTRGGRSSCVAEGDPVSLSSTQTCALPMSDRNDNIFRFKGSGPHPRSGRRRRRSRTGGWWWSWRRSKTTSRSPRTPHPPVPVPLSLHRGTGLGGAQDPSGVVHSRTHERTTTSTAHGLTCSTREERGTRKVPVRTSRTW